jgi:molybdate transport system substrate-binding protein
MHMKTVLGRSCIILLLNISLLVLPAPSPSRERGQEGKEVMVFAAMSMKKPLSELAGIFEKDNSSVTIRFNFAGSGMLAQQIISGAPADIFVSASGRDMDLVEEKGLINKGSRHVFARNSMILVAPRNSRIKIRGFKDLGSREVRRIAIGNPKTVPAGLYAEEIFSSYGMRDMIRDKLIYGEQAAQVCDYVVRGEVDAGIVYFSDYLSRKGDLVLVEKAPPGSHRPVEYPAALITGRDKAAVCAFMGFLISAEAGRVLKKNGFMTDRQV